MSFSVLNRRHFFLTAILSIRGNDIYGKILIICVIRQMTPQIIKQPVGSRFLNEGMPLALE